MAWSTVSFGRYRDKGLSFPQIAFRDPDWLLFMYEADRFDSGPYRREAARIHLLMGSIRIPKPDPENWQVEYTIHNGVFHQLRVVPRGQQMHEGASRTIRLDHLDMRVPKNQKGYDKLGYKAMIGDIKAYWFGSPTKRLTKDACEAFFDDPGNFV